MPGTDIFISYCHDDKSVARLFAGALEAEGFNVWWDTALRSGDTFDEVIERELRAARAVVVLWSPRSVASRWVRAEATLADRMRTLAPVVIEPCDRPIIFELTHTVDLSRWTGDISDPVWQSFTSDLHRLVKNEAVALARPTGPELSANANFGSPSPLMFFANRSIEAANNELNIRKSGNWTSQPSTLQEAFTRSNNQSASYEDELEQTTQFYTAGDGDDPFGNSEFHCLELCAGEKLEQRYIVSSLGLKIGRIPPADVILADAKVSRSHCLVELRDDVLYVSDLNSTNGTFVNDERVTAAAVIPVGSILRIGNFTLKHELRARAEA